MYYGNNILDDIGSTIVFTFSLRVFDIERSYNFFLNLPVHIINKTYFIVILDMIAKFSIQLLSNYFRQMCILKIIYRYQF